MKKIYIILENGMKEFLGYSDSLYDWFFYAEDRIIVPFHGNSAYALVKNIYNEQYNQFVTYKSVPV